MWQIIKGVFWTAVVIGALYFFLGWCTGCTTFKATIPLDNGKEIPILYRYSAFQEKAWSVEKGDDGTFKIQFGSTSDNLGKALEAINTLAGVAP
jgi:hypothetical protein